MVGFSIGESFDGICEPAFDLVPEFFQRIGAGGGVKGGEFFESIDGGVAGVIRSDADEAEPAAFIESCVVVRESGGTGLSDSGPGREIGIQRGGGELGEYARYAVVEVF